MAAQDATGQADPETQDEHEEVEEQQQETTAQAEVPETGKFSF